MWTRAWQQLSVDMRCIRGTAVLHVEVKGTTSLGEQILTRNEVTHAREQYPAIALAIVKNIEIEPGEPVTARGRDLARRRVNPSSDQGVTWG
jgi:hypothetical protein